MRNNKGFTLTEVLVVLVLLTVITTAFWNLLSTSSKDYQSQTKNANSLNELSYIAKLMTRDFRKSVSLQIAGDTFKVGNMNYKVVNNQIERDSEMFQTKFQKICIGNPKSKKSIGCSNELPSYKKNSADSLYIHLIDVEGNEVKTMIYERGGKK
ncbi:prepilin-type N-terminal cleavage/methylation domain-containing protein [Kurthia zopfii]|uniref:prepilin-type N-terminal cleavage/methylation domain-containing protein n=1 Tax=Kurthia zopfii TaxID=1650 RepID=UPI000F6C8C8B|nr:prepilin-type N-terminal cleavage/methylation domain-containing protein [Kurthia zopfii]VEI07932.1 Type II secretory pathway, component PulJ [Kurthia zopfii]